MPRFHSIVRPRLSPGLAGVALFALADSVHAQQPIVRVDVTLQGTPPVNGVDVFATHPISADGRFVVFVSGAADLVSGDTNGGDDLFVRDLINDVTTRVNVSDSEAQANSPAYESAISGDGRFIAFQSGATNLVANDTNNFSDIFLRDRDPDQDGVYDEPDSTTRRISMKTDGKQADGPSYSPAIAAGGGAVVFVSTSARCSAPRRSDAAPRPGSCSRTKTPPPPSAWSSTAMASARSDSTVSRPLRRRVTARSRISTCASWRICR